MMLVEHLTLLEHVAVVLTPLVGAYVSAAVGLIGAATSAYGILSAPSGKVPTAVKAQMAEQQRRADEAYNLQKMLQPVLLDSLGLVATTDAQGNVTGISKKPPTALEQDQAEVQRLATQKVLKGLRGELDVDPAATRSLNERDAQTREYLSRAFGPDYAAGTAGGTALTREAESRNIAESALRRGEMTSAEAIAEASQAADVQQQSLLLSGGPRIPASAEMLALQDPLSSVGEFSYGSRAEAGKAAGYSSVGSGLLAGAGALYGAYLGRNRLSPAPTSAYTIPKNQPFMAGVSAGD